MVHLKTLIGKDNKLTFLFLYRHEGVIFPSFPVAVVGGSLGRVLVFLSAAAPKIHPAHVVSVIYPVRRVNALYPVPHN